MSIAEQPLSGELRAEIRALAQAEPHPRGASVAALRLVQAHMGWISTPHLNEVADVLGMSAADLDGIATYFNLLFRRPVGRHVLMLCDSVSCWIMGCERLCAHLCRTLDIQPGQTTADDAITFLPIVCLGHCDHAPAMLVDDTLYGDVDTPTLDRLIATLREPPP